MSKIIKRETKKLSEKLKEINIKISNKVLTKLVTNEIDYDYNDKDSVYYSRNWPREEIDIERLVKRIISRGICSCGKFTVLLGGNHYVCEVCQKHKENWEFDSCTDCPYYGNEKNNNYTKLCPDCVYDDKEGLWINERCKRCGEEEKEKKLKEGKLSCQICGSNEKVISSTDNYKHPICQKCIKKKVDGRVNKLFNSVKKAVELKKEKKWVNKGDNQKDNKTTERTSRKIKWQQEECINEYLPIPTIYNGEERGKFYYVLSVREDGIPSVIVKEKNQKKEYCLPKWYKDWARTISIIDILPSWAEFGKWFDGAYWVEMLDDDR